MDPVTVGIGTLAIAYGVFSGVMRFVKPSMFKKLEPMKERFGAGIGNTIHFVAYVIVPWSAKTQCGVRSLSILPPEVTALALFLPRIGLDGGR